MKHLIKTHKSAMSGLFFAKFIDGEKPTPRKLAKITPYDHSLNHDENHINAARELCQVNGFTLGDSFDCGAFWCHTTDDK